MPTEQIKVLLTREDIEAIRSALTYKAEVYKSWAISSDASLDLRRAHYAEAEAAQSLAAFLANV